MGNCVEGSLSCSNGSRVSALEGTIKYTQILFMTPDDPAEFRSRDLLNRNIGYSQHKSFKFMGSRHPSQSQLRGFRSL